MTQQRLHQINALCLRICLISIVAGLTLSLLGIWQIIPNNALLWRALGTAATTFVAAVMGSMALGCFKTNE